MHGVRLMILAISLSFPFALAAQEPPAFEPVECFEGVEATECGYVTVPLDHDAPDGEQIRLAVAITRAENAAPDPIMFLAGGPGESGLAYTGLAQLFPNRDFITFDQRGVKMSEPALECPEFDEFATSAEDVENMAQRSQEIIQRCVADLREQGVALENFTASESAADVRDIGVALGYEQVNLIALSYGTRLAQEVLRRYPDIVRSAVLDSVIPPEVDRPAETPLAADQALQRIFEDCANDSACNTAYPDLQQTFNRVVKNLNQAPPTVNIGGDKIPLTGDAFAANIFASMYQPQGIAQIPELIYAMDAGNYEALNESVIVQMAEQVVGSLSWGTFFSHECRGEIAYSDSQALQTTYDQIPMWEEVFGLSVGISAPFIYETCEALGLTEPSGMENASVASDVPTLFTAGEYDPVTPFTWVEQAADEFTNAYTYEIPGFGHAAALGSECSFSIVQAFIENPTTEPDTSCLGDLHAVFNTPQGDD